MDEGQGLVGLGWRSKKGSSNERLPPTDPLSRLPPELLLRIFEEIRLGGILDDQMAGAISHTLLPYTRINLYREVDIYTPLEFKLLRRTVTSGGPQLASLIDAFTLYLDQQQPRNPGQSEYKRRLEDTTAFLAALTHVRELTLRGSTFSAYCLLLESFPAANLRRLRSLTLKDFTYAIKDPFDPLVYAYLGRFEDLNILSLDFSGGANQGTPFPNPTPPSTPLEKNQNIHELKVEGELQGYPGWSPLKHLLGHFANLEGLIIGDYQGVNLAEILGEVTLNLKHLAVLHVEINVSAIWEIIALDPILSRFPYLETLHLGYNTFTPLIFRSICGLRHLRHLSFERWAIGISLTFFDLSFLLSNFSGISPLQVKVNMGGGSIGVKDPPYPISSMQELSRMGWEPPEWTRNFSHDNALALVNRVEESGGKFGLDQSIYIALENQVAYDEQVLQVDIMMEREPFDSLVAMEERIEAQEKERAERAEKEERRRVQQEPWEKQRRDLEEERVRLVEEYG